MKRHPNNTPLSIHKYLVFTMMGLMIVLLVLLTTIQIYTHQTVLKHELARRVKLLENDLSNHGQLLAKTLTNQVEHDLAVMNLYQITQLLQNSVGHYEALSYAILMNKQQIAYLHTQHPQLQQKKLTDQQAIFAAKQNTPQMQRYQKNGVEYLEFINPIRISTDIWGMLRLGFSTHNLHQEITRSNIELNQKIAHAIINASIIVGLLILIGIVLISLIVKHITKPLQTLTTWADKLAIGDFASVTEQPIPDNSHHYLEVNRLAIAFKQMSLNLQLSYKFLEDKVKSRTQGLEQALEQITQAHEELQSSQEQLLQAEKMAALGNLVAGIAHEINTPIGVSITVASHIHQLAKQMAQNIDTEQLTRSELTNYIQDCQEATYLILNNLNRTGELIKSFKMISADQTSQEQRTFNLHDYLHDIIASLQPKLKRTPHQITIQCPKTIILNSFPGAIAQIITNLLLNSVRHAFPNNSTGHITMTATATDKMVKIIYHDNGQGIKYEHQHQIFEPFFTTQRGTGGTGLGLNIVYNITHTTLRGQIHCSSQLGKGTTFTIEIPLTLDANDKISC